MKKIAYYILPLAISFFACDTAEDLTDVEISTTLVKTMPVAVISTDEMTTSIVLDATSDPEIRKYASKIKKYEITELTFAIENYSAPTEAEIYFNGEIGFSQNSQNEASTTCAVSPLPITNFAGNGSFPLSTCDAILDGISDVMVNNNAAKIYLTGSFTKEPVTFDLVVSIKMKVTANPL